MMKSNLIDVVEYLTRLKAIYLSIDRHLLAGDIEKIEELIALIKRDMGGDPSIVNKDSNTESKTKTLFQQNYQLLKQNIFHELQGTKFDYESLLSEADIIEYFDNNKKENVLKKTTALDLKLLYSSLTGEEREQKGTKPNIYDAIVRNIHAGKRGAAFSR